MTARKLNYKSRFVYTSVWLCVPLLLCARLVAAEQNGQKTTNSIPIRGLHLSAPSKKEVPVAIEFIRNDLAKEGVNTLVLEFNYNFDFRSRTEFASPSSIGSEEAREIARACREKGIQLIPGINCLGHQSWAKRNGRLLEKHPEFDETPGKFADNEGIYCRSYCPLHPEVHPVLFTLIDELAKACEATAFHVGMDEVFILADADCPRCQYQQPADMFATEVRALHEHLKTIGCRMWMWGDRFLDGKSTALGKWEASVNGTAVAIDLVPKDIVICDWHYDKAPETPQFFARKGFEVVACPWRKPPVALAQLAHVRAIRLDPDKEKARRGLGMMETTWCGFSAFLKAYRSAQTDGGQGNSAAETATCFRKLFSAIREEQ